MKREARGGSGGGGTQLVVVGCVHVNTSLIGVGAELWEVVDSHG